MPILSENHEARAVESPTRRRVIKTFGALTDDLVVGIALDDSAAAACRYRRPTMPGPISIGFFGKPYPTRSSTLVAAASCWKSGSRHVSSWRWSAMMARTPKVLASRAAAFVSSSTAYLLARDIDAFAAPREAMVEDSLTMLPLPCLLITRSSCFMLRTTPSTFALNVADEACRPARRNRQRYRVPCVGQVQLPSRPGHHRQWRQDGVLSADTFLQPKLASRSGVRLDTVRGRAS